jgi:hypothetical protein
VSTKLETIAEKASNTTYDAMMRVRTLRPLNQFSMLRLRDGRASGVSATVEGSGAVPPTDGDHAVPTLTHTPPP